MNNTAAPAPAALKVWAVTFTEQGGAEEIIHAPQLAPSGFLLFSDSAYDAALAALRAVVADRLGFGYALFSYESDFGTDAHVHIVVRDARADDGEYGYAGDTYQLRPYDVIGG